MTNTERDAAALIEKELGARRERDGCPLTRHAACWIEEGGARIFTFEPYGLVGDDLARLIAALEPLGLELDVSGRSGWYPGEAALITIRRFSDRGDE